MANPIPVRRSRRLNKDLPLENPINESDKKAMMTPLRPNKPFLQKALPKPLQQVNQSPTQTTQSTPENFKSAYEDLNNPLSYSGDIRAIANSIPSYRYEQILQKLSRRLFE